MESTVIEVTSKGGGISEALSLTEKLGIESGIRKKSVIHLRLLAEELFGMLRSIAGDVSANYWIEYNGPDFELHLKSTVELTDEMRKQFISASTSGKNDATRGVMGKIKVMIANFMFSAREALPYTLINTPASYHMGAAAGETAAMWSMSLYKDEIKKTGGKKSAEAWDELEKSIVANIADDVKVCILGDTVEIIINKTFWH
jgi:hypothetical protein